MDSVLTGRRKMIVSVLAAIVLNSFVDLVECQTPLPSQPCTVHSTCDQCVRNVECLWCSTNNTCTDYPMPYVIPPPSVCKLSKAHWGMCWVNFEALLIAVGVVCGTILISITVCCCCCCCCCKKQQSRPDSDEEALIRRREEIRERSEERKAERRAKHDEIRKKYGLIPDADHPYSKYENE